MVKCKDCGFLALRVGRRGHEVNLRPGELVEVPQEYRNSPRGLGLVDSDPVCFMRAKNLEKELQDISANFRAGQPVPNASDDDGQTIAFPENQYKWQIYFDRKCDAFTTWWQGFNPKEHRELIDRQRTQREHRNQNLLNLAVAFLAVLVAGAGIFFSAKYNREAAQLEAEATIKAAEMQIQAQLELLVPLNADTPSVQPPAVSPVNP